MDKTRVKKRLAEFRQLLDESETILDQMNQDEREKQMDFTCEKKGCKEFVPHYLSGRQIIGGLIVNLCPHHLREWEANDRTNAIADRIHMIDHHVHYIALSAASPNPAGWGVGETVIREKNELREKARLLFVKWIESEYSLRGCAEPSK